VFLPDDTMISLKAKTGDTLLEVTPELQCATENLL